MTQSPPLCAQTLGDLPSAVLRPTYDRSAVTAGIVHIGGGNFHRAHQAWYLHRLMQKRLALDWGIVGAGVRSFDDEQRTRLARQDYLYSLVELSPEGTAAEVVGALIDFCPIEPDNRALIQLMADPRIRIVSMTLTEGGYFLDPATKRFDPSATDIQHDVNLPDQPCTAFGAIVAALKIRRNMGLGPFTCLSCDNLPGNGAIMRDVVTGFARLIDPGHAQWIEQNVSFPNSMVDCIVPATGQRERDLAHECGINDAVPVTHESFRQWVLEDRFCAGRPPWEEAGAVFSDRVHDYEAMKLRILNGGHQIIAAPAEILGLQTISDAMHHPAVHKMFRKIAEEELVLHVSGAKDMTPLAYVDLIDQRFANPAMCDTVRRVAFDGSSRHTGAVLPVIREAISKQSPLNGLALSQALWARMCAGTREDGSEITPNDPHWDALTACAAAARDKPRVWLEQRHFYGEIADDDRFSSAFCHWLTKLYKDGVIETLNAYVQASAISD